MAACLPRDFTLPVASFGRGDWKMLFSVAAGNEVSYGQNGRGRFLGELFAGH
eukprot:CAMPEP_0172491720 /NCGR_PEP_ID=MMETSP1066-20121228/22574_1 /TAXON_ID=671091 /ORGANISM="Coscinodiscus wailesii, Strain CCMP2513" /LENGTH=51 /DNA_ID=CAMNT_0013260893 /DNA_START=392 /DNA_END=547 /DNA_ORIENTATION=-